MVLHVLDEHRRSLTYRWDLAAVIVQHVQAETGVEPANTGELSEGRVMIVYPATVSTKVWFEVGADGDISIYQTSGGEITSRLVGLGIVLA